jgi:hypothetical protein
MATGNYGTMISNRGISMPITAMATSVVNAQVDRRSFVDRMRNNKATPYGKGDKHSYGVAKHELVFTMPTDRAYMLHNGMNDPECSVFSSVNGWKLNQDEAAIYEKSKSAGHNDKKLNHDTLNRSICKRLRFMGMCNTTQTDPDSHLSSHVSVTVGGLVTIFNTGPRTLNIGDRVVWEIPPFTQDNDGAMNPKGTPGEKLLFRTLPYDHSAQSTFDGMVGASDDGTEDGRFIKTELNKCVEELSSGQDVDSIKKTLRTFVDVAVECSRELDGRVIGVCLKRAEPGEPFDILMRANKSA